MRSRPCDTIAAVNRIAAEAAARWSALSAELPALHAALAAAPGRGGGGGDPLDAFAAAIVAAPAVRAADWAGAVLDDRRRIGLDVLMVEAFLRRHGGAPPAADRAVADAARAVAGLLGIQPILNYPLYIRHNPLPPERLRTFTPLAAEARFIRMHRAVEDDLDRLIPTLDAVLDAPSAAFGAALAEGYAALAAGFRRVNALMAAFQDPRRMPTVDFADGFRPYYASDVDPVRGQVRREGPSGLQSPTFRAIAMQMGYADHGLDHWTTHLAAYHETTVRDDLERRRRRRDAGDSLADRCAARFGGRDVPRLHADHAASTAQLVAAARAGGWLDDGTLALCASHGLALDAWPADAPRPAGSVPAVAPPDADADADLAALGADDQALLARLVGLEAMLFGFHATHVATAAAQIGRVPGTGGTSGVDFLLIALFRRAFPALWTTGLGAAAARAGLVAAAG